MKGRERQDQDDRYASGEIAWPVGVGAWVRGAAESLPRNIFDWLEGGAGEEWTLRVNREAFETWKLRPKVLSGNEHRHLTTTIAGTLSQAPFLLAPIGGQTLMHPLGELATARAAAEAGIPLIVSTASSFPIEEIADHIVDGSLWFQLYWASDLSVVESFIDRAEACGCGAIVLTVDTATVGWRDRDLRSGFVPGKEGAGFAQYASDPAFRRRLSDPWQANPEEIRQEVGRILPSFHLTWEEVKWLRARTSLPVLIKGIVRGDDAAKAFDTGADGIIVSNHGGRQLDGAVSSLQALTEVREKVGDDHQVLMDGGIRRGTDVVKALALGADAVLLGRPFMYGLAIAGQAGVKAVIQTLVAEIDMALGLVGVRDPQSLDRSFVTKT